MVFFISRRGFDMGKECIMPYDNKVKKVINKMEIYNPGLTVVSIKKYGFMYLINALHSLKPPFVEMDSL